MAKLDRDGIVARAAQEAGDWRDNLWTRGTVPVRYRFPRWDRPERGMMTTVAVAGVLARTTGAFR